MTILQSKPIVIIILVCFALTFLKRYRMRLRLKNKEKKIVDAIGKYDKELNKTNITFLVGKGDARGEE